MAFNLRFQTKYILKHWCMLLHPAKVSLKVQSSLWVLWFRTASLWSVFVNLQHQLSVFSIETKDFLCSLGIGFHIGEFLLAVVGYFIREWKTLQLSVHIFALLLLGSYFIVPESIRWLNSKEKYVEVKRILHKRAATNKRLPIPEELFYSVNNDKRYIS